LTKRIYTVEEVELQDWEKPVRIFPLTIKKFRRLADILEQLSPSEEDRKKKGYKEKAFLDVILEATAFAMETYEPELAVIDKLADHIDMPTMEHILDVAAGVKLGDPNQQAATGIPGTS
jgi:hypothetical protein